VFVMGGVDPVLVAMLEETAGRLPYPFDEPRPASGAA
jgi:hypothetical protein